MSRVRFRALPVVLAGFALCFFALFCASLASAQGGIEASVRVYLYGNEVRDVEAVGEDVYAATSGGLVRYRDGEGFRQWNRSAGGLLSDSVNVVAEAADGSLWCGTARAGISVFDVDTEKFTPFTSLLEPIPGDRIRSLRFSSEGAVERFFVGAEQGFAVFENLDLRSVCLQGVDLCGLPSFDVRDAAPLADELWLATASGVVARRADGEFEPRAAGLGANSLHRFAVDDSLYALSAAGVHVWRGDRWGSLESGLPAGFLPADLRLESGAMQVAGSSGVYQRSGGAWSKLGAQNFPATSLTRTASGRLFAGASDPGESLDGIWEWNNTAWIQHRLEGPSLRSNYRALHFTADGALWLSTAARGVAPLITRFGGGTWQRFEVGGQRLNAWTFDLLDLRGDLWLAHCCCTRGNEEQCRLERRRAETNTFEPFAGIANAWDMTTDGAGRLWVATTAEVPEYANGFYIISATGAIERHYTLATSFLLSDQVRAVELVGEELWIGYEFDGVHRVQLDANGLPSTLAADWRHYATTTNPALGGDQVRRMEFGPDGRVWIGTTSGLSIWDGFRFTSTSSGFGRLPTPEVTGILPLDDGGAWVSTRDGGLTRLTPRSTGGFDYETIGPPTLPNPDIEALALSPDGATLWLATSRGLASFRPRGAEAAAADGAYAYPNPFLPGCSDGVRLAETGGRATGVIVDLSGQIVHRFEEVDPGELLWDGRSDGERVAPGLYWVRARTPRGIESVGVAVMDAACE